MKQSESDLIDHIDLMTDEFIRIKALNPRSDIVDICERALLVTEQNVPVIVQRDRLQSEVNKLRVQIAISQETGEPPLLA
tara:strand:- start:52 stop:291 length:240 start_codon:yes stop_codon:yes gene_type:complete